MTQIWIVGVVVVWVFTAATAAARDAEQAQESSATQLPRGELVLGTVAIPRPVLADGKPLSAGRYTVRLTADTAQPVPGVNADLERWVEFVQGGKVRGRELASVIPAGDEKETMPGPDMPGRMGRSGVRVEMLKGGEYLRIWIARADHDYLIHLPPQSAAK